jgi:hypothetical protein
MDRVPKTHSLQVNGLHFFQLNLKTVNIYYQIFVEQVFSPCGGRRRGSRSWSGRFLILDTADTTTNTGPRVHDVRGEES